MTYDEAYKIADAMNLPAGPLRARVALAAFAALRKAVG